MLAMSKMTTHIIDSGIIMCIIAFITFSSHNMNSDWLRLTVREWRVRAGKLWQKGIYLMAGLRGGRGVAARAFCVLQVGF